jgi:hypothetical protein
MTSLETGTPSVESSGSAEISTSSNVHSSSDTLENQRISISVILGCKDFMAYPIESCSNIPGINIPQHMRGKKRTTEVDDIIRNNVRKIFNTIALDNIQSCKDELKKIVKTKVKNLELLTDVAREILENFLTNKNSTEIYMHLLNNIDSESIQIKKAAEGEVDKLENYKILRDVLLDLCKAKFMEFISVEKIRSVSSLNRDDMDELDKYTRESERMCCLMKFFCSLYKQRLSKNIHLTSKQMMFVINALLNNHKRIIDKMNSLGNPYEGECTNDDEYMACRLDCDLYTEMLCELFEQQGKQLNNDKFIEKDQTTLSSLINRFKTEVIPNLEEKYLVSKCNAIKF